MSEIEFLNKMIDKRKKFIEDALNLVNNEREEIVGLNSVRQKLSEKNDTYIKLKDIATEILKNHTSDVITEQINVNNIKYKLCRSCNEKKSFDEFSKDKRRLDGKQLYCKACQSEKMKEWHKKNRKTGVTPKQKAHPFKIHLDIIDTFKKYIGESWHPLSLLKEPFSLNNKDLKISTINRYLVAHIKFLEKEENCELEKRYVSGVYCFRFKNFVPDIHISNGTKKDSIPVIDSGVKDRKTMFNWNKFKLKGQ